MKEMIILLIQLLLFYVFPLFIEKDVIGMVLFLVLITFILSIILGSITGKKIKYFYPLVVSIVFIPSIFIYYNESALVHSVWYLIVSFIGIILGSFIFKTSNKD